MSMAGEGRPCRGCGGSGQRPMCKKCWGKGTVSRRILFLELSHMCITCQGSGRVEGQCNFCLGTGLAGKTLDHVIIDV